MVFFELSDFDAAALGGVLDLTDVQAKAFGILKERVARVSEGPREDGLIDSGMRFRLDSRVGECFLSGTHAS